jgi:hypothetical protein
LGQPVVDVVLVERIDEGCTRSDSLPRTATTARPVA